MRGLRRLKLRRVPGAVLGRLGAGNVVVTAVGTLGDADDPGALRWEIGSITKVFTGVLLAEMSIRGEVALDDPIGRYLPDAVAARLPDDQPRLVDLASHTAGLPRIPLPWLRRMRGSDDPYALLTEADVFDQLGERTKRPRRPRVQYSNFGMGLLGHLLGRAGHGPYRDLIRSRILEPLGLSSTSFGGDVVAGFRKGGPTPPWTFGALEAAGALRSTAADMMRLAGWVIEPPSGPLGEALDLARRPVYRGRFGLGTMGLGWQHRPRVPGKATRDTVWHNGGTFATSSFLAVDPSAGVAAVVFGNAGSGLRSPVDAAGWELFDSPA